MTGPVQVPLARCFECLRLVPETSVTVRASDGAKLCRECERREGK